jgi:hypothetical protein
MKKGNVFWGMLLLIIGAILILRNTGLLIFNIHSFIRLWPFIFIFWGIAVLPVKGFIKLILLGVMAIIAIFLLVQYPAEEYRWFRWHNDSGEEFQQHISESYDSTVKTAKLNLDAAAGKFYIKNKSGGLYEIDNEGGFGTYKAKTTIDGSAATIDIRQMDQHIRGGKFKNNVWLALNPEPVWDLNIEAGAAGLEMDVTTFRVERIDIKGGASSLELRLGDLSELTRLNIDAGASSIEVKIPQDSGCELHTSTVLSSRDIEGFDKIEGGLYRTSNYSSASNKVIIEVDAAVSSLEIRRF